MLEFLPVVFSHHLPDINVCADGKYAKLSIMQACDVHFFVEHLPCKRRGGEARSD